MAVNSVCKSESMITPRLKVGRIGSAIAHWSGAGKASPVQEATPSPRHVLCSLWHCDVQGRENRDSAEDTEARRTPYRPPLPGQGDCPRELPRVRGRSRTEPGP